MDVSTLIFAISADYFAELNSLLIFFLYSTTDLLDYGESNLIFHSGNLPMP